MCLDLVHCYNGGQFGLFRPDTDVVPILISSEDGHHISGNNRGRRTAADRIIPGRRAECWKA